MIINPQKVQRMSFTTIITVSELAKHIGDPDWVIVDCRFKLASPDHGKIDYKAAHIPGAVYAHLEDDLSGHIIKGVTGRHPLPSVDKISRVFSRFGIDSSVQVVAYDDMGGAVAAVRGWWFLHLLGYGSVAVLDGGLQEWVKKRFSMRYGKQKMARRH